MQFTSEQVLALAPDAAVAKDAKKLANLQHWRALGQSSAAIWGECQGSALYQVRVDPTALSVTCSCPSRKFPCKHGVALLLLVAADDAAVPQTDAPEWVTAWLAKRAAAEQRRQQHTHEPPADAAGVPAKTAPTDDQIKRIQKREALIAHGLTTLDRWLDDLVRTGLASVETQAATFWEQQAAQLVDAQAPGMAARIRRLAAIPGASPQWPERLLDELGKVALLSHAYQRVDVLDAAQRDDLRPLIGWTYRETEITEHGDRVTDTWLVLGQHSELDDKQNRTQFTWMLGEQTQRVALNIQFSFRGAEFKELFWPGTKRPGELAFWPGAAAVRARGIAWQPDVAPISGRLPGAGDIPAALATVATALTRQPWQERFLCLLRDVTVCPAHADVTPLGELYLRDTHGNALPLRRGEQWQLLCAVSGGHPVDVAAEWDGTTLLPLGVAADDVYTAFVEAL